MNNKVILIPGKRKYLLLADQNGKQELKGVFNHFFNNNLSFEFVFIGEKCETDIFKWLSQQKMGCYLYVSLPWGKVNEYKRMLEGIGYSDEEYQFIGHGEQTINVFCCRCHGINSASANIVEITCQHCQLKLEITDHYSSLRDAYLGFVAKL